MSDDGTNLTQLTGEAVEDLVEIGESRYALAREATYGLIRQARCRAIRKRMAALEEIEAPSVADEEEYRTVGRELAGYALPDAPAPVLDALDHEQLGDLAVLFFGRGAMRGRRLEIMTKLISGMSSPGSNGSTAATP